MTIAIEAVMFAVIVAVFIPIIRAEFRGEGVLRFHDEPDTRQVRDAFRRIQPMQDHEGR